MNDMGGAITPKSDQLNADDLLTGPITITITGTSIKAGQEQPVSISYENDNGKPYKPCKSMCRVLVAAWGPDASKYTGRSLTLYCDPKVRWGGMEVGGLRISHMSHIPESMTMALTVTRANKKPFTVRPIAPGTPKAEASQVVGQPGSASIGADPSTPASASAPNVVSQINTTLGFASDVLKKRYTARLVAGGVKSTEELSADDQAKALEWLKSQIDREATAA